MADESKTTSARNRSVPTAIAEIFSPHFPDLKKKLVLANISKTPIEFLERVSVTAIYLSVGFLFLTGVFFVMQMPPISVLWLLPLAFVYFLAVFYYLMLYPDAIILKRQRELDYEVVFAGRQIVIAVKSGMPLFDAVVGATSGYGEVSRELSKIADQVVLGIPITQAIREEAQSNPSKYFTRLLMQIANSVSSGADVGNSLEIVLDQISREQQIALKEYSQKLTPIVMFFMVFGIIVPSLGVVLATVIFSAISGGTLGLTSSVLVPVFFLIVVIQFLFLGMIETSRPKYII
jgi:pilus assembly protein TadC